MTQLPSPALSPPLLLATDGSPSARMAQTLMQSIATLFVQTQDENSEILVVVTVQPRPSKRLKRSSKKIAPAPSESGLEVVSVEVEGAAAPSSPSGRSQGGLSLGQLSELVATNFPPNFPLSLQVRQGRPATEILNCARSVDAGLIAIGHRGVGGVRELLLGSVSTAIARYAPCSVLVARTRADLPAPASLNHALLVVDGSLAARQTLAIARQLAPAGIQTVTLLHIQPPLNASYLVTPFVSRTSSWQLNQSLQDAHREQGEQILQKAAATLNNVSNLTVQTRLHTGDAGPSICQVAQEVGANLIILGSDSTRRSLLSPLQAVRLPRRKQSAANSTRPVLRNTRLSVTDDYVIHYAPCPVLLCRAVAEES
ncbi:MAG: universal stress protein [Leptolyngbyaceae cyanobacterium bins.302]|nr:universal stress protein [Leptolyngbyaceae cyanobacterium bins.302]